jgi:fatty-acid peroxygenase
MSTRKIPRDRHWDATIPMLVGGGYRYISQMCDRLGSDIFQTRLLLRRAICIRGKEAAELFYNQALFQRTGAVPTRIQRSLLGKGGVHGLDGEEHLERKRMFMSLMRASEIERLNQLAISSWETQIQMWKSVPEFQLQSEVRQILTRAVCRWAGVPLNGDLADRANDLSSMVDAFGAVGPRFWRGTRARRKSEEWIRLVIREIRRGGQPKFPNSPAVVVATWRDRRSRLLDEHTAAVELLNLLRPTVAVSYLVVFAALALHSYPHECHKVLDGDTELEYFVQEVRRFFPFAPVMGAISRVDVLWQSYLLPENTLVVLDLFGTNHDPRLWNRPDEFRPERFASWDGGAFNFIPQGGGDANSGHRCAGERITIEQIKIATAFLAERVSYEVPSQDLRYSLNRLPTAPRSGFVMRQAR